MTNNGPATVRIPIWLSASLPPNSRPLLHRFIAISQGQVLPKPTQWNMSSRNSNRFGMFLLCKKFWNIRDCEASRIHILRLSGRATNLSSICRILRSAIQRRTDIKHPESGTSPWPIFFRLPMRLMTSMLRIRELHYQVKSQSVSSWSWYYRIVMRHDNMCAASLPKLRKTYALSHPCDNSFPSPSVGEVYSSENTCMITHLSTQKSDPSRFSRFYSTTLHCPKPFLGHSISWLLHPKKDIAKANINPIYSSISIHRGI